MLGPSGLEGCANMREPHGPRHDVPAVSLSESLNADIGYLVQPNAPREKPPFVGMISPSIAKPGVGLG